MQGGGEGWGVIIVISGSTSRVLGLCSVCG